MIQQAAKVCVVLLIIFVAGNNALHHLEKDAANLIQKVKTLTFLITVNDTWDPNGCIKTVKTPPLVPKKRSSSVMVGSCDQGPIEFFIVPSSDNKSLMMVDFTFHSSVIVDASPPACKIPWNGTYMLPTKMADPLPSLLPGCFVMDSREGYHMTSYWFYLIDWVFE